VNVTRRQSGSSDVTVSRDRKPTYNGGAANVRTWIILSHPGSDCLRHQLLRSVLAR